MALFNRLDQILCWVIYQQEITGVSQRLPMIAKGQQQVFYVYDGRRISGDSTPIAQQRVFLSFKRNSLRFNGYYTVEMKVFPDPSSTSTPPLNDPANADIEMGSQGCAEQCTVTVRGFLYWIIERLWPEQFDTSMIANQKLRSYFETLTPKSVFTLQFHDKLLEKEYQSYSNIKYEFQNTITFWISAVAIAFYGSLIFLFIFDATKRNAELPGQLLCISVSMWLALLRRIMGVNHLKSYGHIWTSFGILVVCFNFLVIDEYMTTWFKLVIMHPFGGKPRNINIFILSAICSLKQINLIPVNISGIYMTILWATMVAPVFKFYYAVILVLIVVPSNLTAVSIACALSALIALYEIEAIRRHVFVMEKCLSTQSLLFAHMEVWKITTSEILGRVLFFKQKQQLQKQQTLMKSSSLAEDIKNEIPEVLKMANDPMDELPIIEGTTTTRELRHNRDLKETSTHIHTSTDQNLASYFTAPFINIRQMIHPKPDVYELKFASEYKLFHTLFDTWESSTYLLEIRKVLIATLIIDIANTFIDRETYCRQAKVTSITLCGGLRDLIVEIRILCALILTFVAMGCTFFRRLTSNIHGMHWIVFIFGLIRALMFSYLCLLSITTDRTDSIYHLFICYVVSTLIITGTTVTLRLQFFMLLGTILSVVTFVVPILFHSTGLIMLPGTVVCATLIGGLVVQAIMLQKKRFFVLKEILCEFPEVYLAHQMKVAPDPLPGVDAAQSSATVSSGASVICVDEQEQIYMQQGATFTLRFCDTLLEKHYQTESNLKYEFQNTVSAIVAAVGILFYGFL
ncbi:hypothetical protein HDU76_001596, partial [Blyttiomyces sp. JEL0837]